MYIKISKLKKSLLATSLTLHVGNIKNSIIKVCLIDMRMASYPVTIWNVIPVIWLALLLYMYIELTSLSWLAESVQ